MRRPLVATTIDDDCTVCGAVIDIGEPITELTAGTAHVACFGKMLPPEREYASRAMKAPASRKSPGKYRPGVVS